MAYPPVKNRWSQKKDDLEDVIVALEISSQLQFVWHQNFGCVYTLQLLVLKHRYHIILFLTEPLNTTKFEREVSLLCDVGPQFQTQKNAPKMAMKWLSRCRIRVHRFVGRCEAMGESQQFTDTKPKSLKFPPSQPLYKNPAWRIIPVRLSG